MPIKNPVAVSEPKSIGKASPRIFDRGSLLEFFNKLSFSSESIPGSALNKFTFYGLREKIQYKKTPLTRKGKIMGCVFLLPRGSSFEGDLVTTVPWSLMKSAVSRTMNHEKILLYKDETGNGAGLVFVPERLLNSFGLSAVNRTIDAEAPNVIPFKGKGKDVKAPALEPKSGA